MIFSGFSGAITCMEKGRRLLRFTAVTAACSPSPERSEQSLPARYLSFSLLDCPSRPFVYAGETAGSASSQYQPRMFVSLSGDPLIFQVQHA